MVDLEKSWSSLVFRHSIISSLGVVLRDSSTDKESVKKTIFGGGSSIAMKYSSAVLMATASARKLVRRAPLAIHNQTALAVGV